MRFRKKPVVIEAVQFGGSSEDVVDIKNWMTSGVYDKCLVPTQDLTTLSIHTLEGTMRAEKGDWIIRGVKGEFYPCKPDIFEATYEPVAESEASK